MASVGLKATASVMPRYRVVDEPRRPPGLRDLRVELLREREVRAWRASRGRALPVRRYRTPSREGRRPRS